MNLRGIVQFGTGFIDGYTKMQGSQRRDAAEEREKERFDFEKEQRDRDETWKKGREEIRTRYTTEPVYTSVDDGGVPVQVGTRKREMAFKDNLKMVEDMAAHDFQHGKMSVMGFAQAKDRVKQMQNEGLLDAHQTFVDTGDIRKAAAKFNEVGAARVDPDSLTAQEQEGPFGKQVVYSGKTADGKPFKYDPVQAAAMVGGAKGFLSMTEAADKAARSREELGIKKDEVRRRGERDVLEDKRKDRELDLKERDLNEVKIPRAGAYATWRGSSGASDKTTAMQRNVEYLVATGVAENHGDAFAKLRSAMEKPDRDATLAVAQNLMRSPRYMGKGGNERAMADAREMVGSLKGGDSGRGTFGSAEDVRAAYKAGKIDRARAMKELGAFGFAPE